MTDAQARAFLAGAREVRLAGCSAAGVPILRTVNGVVVDGALAFHGSPAGEKLELLGREVVLCAEEVVVQVPSHFMDPERACPATTLYRSVQVHGVLEPVEEPAAKARALQALMEKLQPEGGYVPIREDHPHYRAAVKGLLIAHVALTRMDGKAKLAQNKSPRERAILLERFWERGEPADLRAVDLVAAANPDTPLPAFLAAPEGVRLLCAPEPWRALEAAALLVGAYWTQGLSQEQLARSLRQSSAWLAAQDADGRIIGVARLLGDGVRWAGLYDVMVAPAWRGKGLGKALVRLALAHPAARGASKVFLRTRDAHGLYRGFGFGPAPAPEPGLDMERVRAPAEGAYLPGGHVA